MKVTCLYFVILITSFSSSFGQEPNYKWSSITLNKKGYFNRVIGENDNGYHLLKAYGSGNNLGYSLVTIAKDLSSHKTIPINFFIGTTGNDYHLDKTFTVNNKIYFTKRHWYKKEKTESLILEEIDSKGNLVNPIELSKHFYTKMLNRGKSQVYFSPDKLNMLVLRLSAFEKKTETYTIELICFNTSTMKKIWSKETILDIPSQKYPNFRARIDNSGNVVVFCKFKKDKVKQFNLYTYNNTSKVFKQIDDARLSENQRVNEITILSDSIGHFVIAGTYYDKNLVKNKMLQGYMSHGVFCFTIRNIDNLVAGKITPFTDEVLLEDFNSLKILRGERYLNGLLMKRSAILSNGKLLLVLERRVSSKVNKGTAEKPRWVQQLNAEIIMSFNIDPKTGELMWAKGIRKNQFASGSARKYISFIPYLVGDNLHVFWNNPSLKSSPNKGKWTEADGSTYEKLEVFGKYTGYAPFQYVIKPDGTVLYGDLKNGLPLSNIFATERTHKLSLNTSFYFQTNDGLLILAEFSNGLKYKFGLLSFDAIDEK